MTETPVSASSGPPVFPMRRTCPFQPPAEYAEMRSEGHISRIALPTGRVVWAVTGHELMRQVLADPRFSANKAHPDFPSPSPGFQAVAQQMAKAFGIMDPPEHTKHRRMMIDEFTAKRMRALRPLVQKTVDGLVDDLLAGPRPADLVKAFSLPVSTQVICELLGVPYKDRDFFFTVTSLLADRGTPAERRISASIELRTYLDELVAAKEQEPSDDLTGRLIAKYREADEYDHERITVTIMMLLVAGHETTANMISLSTVALLEHPSQLAAFKADPSLVSPAVEELLRCLSIADGGTGRVALEDVEMGGVLIRKGEGVIALAAAANHDPDVYERPGELDIRRTQRGHLAFGHGIHNCIGQNLARLELEIALPTLFERVPGLRLATPAAELPYKDDGQVYGIHEVPVTW